MSVGDHIRRTISSSGKHAIVSANNGANKVLDWKPAKKKRQLMAGVKKEASKKPERIVMRSEPADYLRRYGESKKDHQKRIGIEY